MHGLPSAEDLSEWRQAVLPVRVPEWLSSLGTKEKCKLSIRLTMVIIRRILLQGHSWSQITYSDRKKTPGRPLSLAYQRRPLGKLNSSDPLADSALSPSTTDQIAFPSPLAAHTY